MYNGNYSDHHRNYSVLQNYFMLRASNFVSIKDKTLSYCMKIAFKSDNF
ncbi:hypothetical protein T05_7122 [Trichinella murrelli]|uniref:Uncharacterized protein n=1 Tax=Trichinella murrelli TaxID=144512 RepID=A0A0V0SS97_9BILA|nr:hypothetical protein T05_7122 [Trichinella murrelli]